MTVLSGDCKTGSERRPLHKRLGLSAFSEFYYISFSFVKYEYYEALKEISPYDPWKQLFLSDIIVP